MDIYKKNIKILKDRYPQIHERLNSTESLWELKASKRGSMTIARGRTYLHSRYDPIKEAKQFIARESIESDKTWIICGFALGYHIQELLANLDRYNLIVIIESDVDVFKKALSLFDYTDLIADDRVVLFVGEDSDSIYDKLATNFFKFMAAGFSILEWKSSTAMHVEYYSEVTTKLKDVIRLGHANIKTVKLNGRRMMSNTFNNMPQIFKSRGVKELGSLIDGMGAIIVSAGPSLNKNINDLKAAKGKLLIVATDTALKILLKNEIEPDFVITMDYKPESAKHFQGLDTSSIPMVFDSESAPESLLEYEGPLFSSLATRPLSLWTGLISEDKGVVLKGMSVAHTAFNFLLLLGADPIIFVGQDLSFPGGKTHADGTHSREEISKEDKNYFWVKSEVSGEELLTRNDMYIYLKHFERMVRETDVRCVNATEGGLGIKGAEHIDLAEAIEKYGDKTGKLKDVLSQFECSSVSYDKYKVVESLKDLRIDFADMSSAAERVSEVLKSLIVKINKDAEYSSSMVAQTLYKTNSDVGLIRSKTLCLKLIHQEFVQELMQMQREGELSKDDIKQFSKDDMLKSLEQDLNFQCVVEDASKFMIAELDKLVEKLTTGKAK